MSVGLHEQERLAIAGQADFGVVLDAADGHAVEELQGAGDDLRRDDVGDRLRGVFHAVIARQHRATGGGAGDDFEQDFGDDAEGAFGSDEEVLHRVARDILHAGVAEMCDAAVGQNDLEAHDVIAGHAVFKAAQAAGVFGHIAADRADFHRTRVGRIEEAVLIRRRIDGGRDGAALRADGEVGGIDREDLVQTRQAEDEAAFRGHAAAAESGAGAAGDDRDVQLAGEFDDRGDFVGRAG